VIRYHDTFREVRLSRAVEGLVSEAEGASGASRVGIRITNRAINLRAIRIPVDDPDHRAEIPTLAGTTRGGTIMTGLLFADLAEFSSAQLLGLWISAMGIGALMIISLAGVWAGAWTTVHKHRLDHALKQQMVDRGMTAEEMIAVMSGANRRRPGEDLPCACEVAVRIDDEWQTGLILKQDGDRYFVHVVGTDMDENQWVGGERVRFPAGTDGRCGEAGEGAFLSEFARMASGCGNGQRAKPAGVDQDL
jgi:hypothetical protein